MELITKIEQLLKSTVLVDILIAIQLAYALPSEEFAAFFNRNVPTGVLPEDQPYYFIRDNQIYFLGSAYLGRSENDLPIETFFMYRTGSYNHYIDLTPDTNINF